jgi:hypothetical protein
MSALRFAKQGTQAIVASLLALLSALPCTQPLPAAVLVSFQSAALHPSYKTLPQHCPTLNAPLLRRQHAQSIQMLTSCRASSVPRESCASAHRSTMPLSLYLLC